MNALTLPIQQSRRSLTDAAILGLGLAVPHYSIEQSDAARIAQRLLISSRWHDALPALYRRSGVARRGSVILNNESSDLTRCQSFYFPASQDRPFGPTTAERMQLYAVHAGPLLHSACQRALAQAGQSARQLTHLITVSCSGFSSPGVDFELIRRLDLSPSIHRSHIGFMGCHAALNAMRVAKSLVESTPDSAVLIGAVELCSLHQQYSDDAQQLVANSLFADGAAGLVVGSQSRQSLATENDIRPVWKIFASGSIVLPETTDAMSWTIGDHGFFMELSPRVPGLIQRHLRPWLETWLNQNRCSLDQIDGWAIHPGGPRIVRAVGEALELDEALLAPSFATLANHGNMSSPTVLFILDQIGRSNPTAKTCLLIAFGPGLCIEAVLLKQTPSI